MSSFQPGERRVDVGSLSLGYLEYGDPSNRSVIMVHGLGDSAWSLDPLAQTLARTHRVFSFDLRGHGRSDWGAYTLAHFVGDLRGAVETLELERPIVIGHSLGGHAASQFCGIYPEIPSAAVIIEGLGPPPNRRAESDPDGHQRDYWQQVIERVRRPARSRPHESLDAAIERFQRAHPLLDPARAAFLVEKNTKDRGDGSVEWRFDPETRDWLAGHDHERAEQRWRGVACPTLVVLGNEAWERFWQPNMIMSQDLDGPMSEAELARRLANFANVQYLTMEGAGHMVHYDKPDELNMAVGEFVSSLPPA